MALLRYFQRVEATEEGLPHPRGSFCDNPLLGVPKSHPVLYSYQSTDAEIINVSKYSQRQNFANVQENITCKSLTRENFNFYSNQKHAYYVPVENEPDAMAVAWNVWNALRNQYDISWILFVNF